VAWLQETNTFTLLTKNSEY